MAWSQEPVSMPHHLIFFLQHPVQRVEVRARVIAEVFHQILLRLAFIMSVPAGVQNEDVALADVGAGALDDLRRDHRPVVHVLGDVDHHAAIDQIIERQVRHVALPVIGRMHGAVEMGADMQRGVDALRDDPHRLQILRVIHFVAGIADPAGRVHVHDVGEIDDLHRVLSSGFALLRLILSECRFPLFGTKRELIISGRAAPGARPLPPRAVRCHTFRASASRVSHPCRMFLSPKPRSFPTASAASSATARAKSACSIGRGILRL